MNRNLFLPFKTNIGKSLSLICIYICALFFSLTRPQVSLDSGLITLCQKEHESYYYCDLGLQALKHNKPDSAQLYFIAAQHLGLNPLHFKILMAEAYLQNGEMEKAALLLEETFSSDDQTFRKTDQIDPVLYSSLPASNVSKPPRNTITVSLASGPEFTHATPLKAKSLQLPSEIGIKFQNTNNWIQRGMFHPKFALKVKRFDKVDSLHLAKSTTISDPTINFQPSLKIDLIENKFSIEPSFDFFLDSKLEMGGYSGLQISYFNLLKKRMMFVMLNATGGKNTEYQKISYNASLMSYWRQNVGRKFGIGALVLGARNLPPFDMSPFRIFYVNQTDPGVLQYYNNSSYQDTLPTQTSLDTQSIHESGYSYLFLNTSNYMVLPRIFFDWKPSSLISLELGFSGEWRVYDKNLIKSQNDEDEVIIDIARNKSDGEHYIYYGGKIFAPLEIPERMEEKSLQISLAFDLHFPWQIDTGIELFLERRFSNFEFFEKGYFSGVNFNLQRSFRF